jgi:GWxTD domain-containing protein
MNTLRGQAVLLVVLLGAGKAAAQDTDQRVALDRLRDSISLSHDTTGLLTLERVWMETARAERDDPMHHLRLGLIAMRLAELRPSVPHLDHAIGEFEWAAELRPEWPWPWYGIGLAEARGRDRAGGFAGGLWTMLGQDRDRLSGQAFARAIAADPSFVRGLLEFARVALDQRIDAPLFPALEALRSATSTMVGWDPDLLLARGRVERRAGFADSAHTMFRRAALLARRPAIAQLELARTTPLTGPISGTEGQARREETAGHYLAAAVSDDPVLKEMFRRDLEPIATRAELAAFDRQLSDDRATWLAEFWKARDAVDLREAGSRLAEHFRRWDVARRDFRLPPFRRRYRWGVEIYQSGDAELDDRGIVYVRHGEPSRRIVWPSSRTPPRTETLRRNYGNESWRYDRPDGPLTLHFVARDDPSDFRLVDSPLELDVALDQLERFAHELPGLARIIRSGAASVDWVTEEVRQETRASMAIATRTDSWQRQYDEILSGRAQWLAAGVRDGQPLVHIVYALDADAVRAALPAGSTHVPVRVRASFFEVGGRAVAQLDTVQFIPVPGAGAGMVAARAEVPVHPGRLLVRLGVELDAEHGMIYPIDSLIAPRPNARAPEVSALLIGLPGQSLPWQVSPADTAWLDAGGVYAGSDTISVYAEAYGMPAGQEATIRLAVTRRRTGISRVLGGNATAVQLSERFVVGDPTVPFRRDLALGGLEPGTYSLELTIEAAGRTVERRRGIVVR